MSTFTVPLDRRTLLSTLWIVLLFNYVYCDVLSLNDPAYLAAVESGIFAGVPFRPEFLVVAGVLMQIPIAMVLLSRVLNDRVARWTNLAAAIIMIVVQLATLLDGTSVPVSLFFSVIEIALLTAIIVCAARWPQTVPVPIQQPASAAV